MWELFGNYRVILTVLGIVVCALAASWILLELYFGDYNCKEESLKNELLSNEVVAAIVASISSVLAVPVYNLKINNIEKNIQGGYNA